MSTQPMALRTARYAISLMFFANGMLLASWAARIPTIQQQLQLDPGPLGIALWGLAVGSLVAFSYVGWLIVHLGSRLTTTIAAIVCCCSLVLPALAPNLLLLWLSLMLLGMGNSVMDVSMNAQAASLEESYRRPIMSSFHGLWSIGALVGASGGSLMAWLNIMPLFHFLLVSGLLLLVVLLASRWLLPTTAKPSEKTPVFARPTKALLGLGIIGFCSFMSEGAMADWSGVYLHRSLGTSAGLAALAFAVYSLAMTVARLLGDSITKRIGPVLHVRLGGLLAALGLGLALLFQQPILALVGFACVGAGLACMAPLVFSTASRTPNLAPGLALAAVATMSYTGSLVGPPVIGQVAELISLPYALGLLALLGLVIVLLAPTLARTPQHEAEVAELV
ncbi:MFS transporter [Ktedonobacter racemifer]|uniref:Major facilitator superfamily MFS_1 n=1 Tax=Ktedonobacter racemifer DSM 44963 TaxID=485913 RepID=D6TYG6_KTERA|nr:MFS transporter [Ktedonobacter racemifer]EFH83246.1 major facilitator superfamily MFS_1 [Ktedonobacter racemifer DSM 44963]